MAENESVDRFYSTEAIKYRNRKLAGKLKTMAMAETTSLSSTIFNLTGKSLIDLMCPSEFVVVPLKFR